MRGAVIARKVSHCSKTYEGAEAYSAFTSVIRTLARKVDDDTLVGALCDVFGGAPLPASLILTLFRKLRKPANQLLWRVVWVHGATQHIVERFLCPGLIASQH